MDPARTIVSEDQLRELYRQPSARAADKVQDRLDPASVRFIARSPFALLATADAMGRCDVSPRGGPPGFITVLDERHLSIPDLGGNNRLDSFRNLLSNPHAALLLTVPGRDETLRVAGPAVLTEDPAVLGKVHPELRHPKLCLVIETAELFAHCAKAFRRGRVWDPAIQPELADAPDLAEIYACQVAGTDEEATRQALEEAYAEALIADRR